MNKEALECIKSLSRIEGATISLGGITNRSVFLDNINNVMSYFTEELSKEQEPEVNTKDIENLSFTSFTDAELLLIYNLINNTSQEQIQDAMPVGTTMNIDDVSNTLFDKLYKRYNNE